MRAAKERKRMAEAESLEPVGGLTTWGCLGKHEITLLVYPADNTHYAIMVDGNHRRARTLRGVYRCITRMIAGETGA